MDFNEATNRLCERIHHKDVAQALGVSVQTVKQARLGSGKSARRPAPAGWRDQIIRLAELRARHYQGLVDELLKTEG